MQRSDLFGSGVKDARSKGSAKKSLNSNEKSQKAGRKRSKKIQNYL
jgi:hypothetical protein